MKKLSFIAIILLLAVFTEGCASIGYSRATYGGDQYKGLVTSISAPVMPIDESSHLSAELHFGIYNNETVPNKSDIMDGGVGITYYRDIFSGFGLYGGGGYSGTNYMPKVNSITRQTGNGLYYEAGITAFHLLRIGYRAAPLGNSTMDAYYAELMVGI